MRRPFKSPLRGTIVLPQKRREDGISGNDRDLYMDSRRDRDYGSDSNNVAKRRRIEIIDDDPRDTRQNAHQIDPSVRDWDTASRKSFHSELSTDEISSKCSTSYLTCSFL